MVKYGDVPALSDRLISILNGEIDGAAVGGAARTEVERRYSARSMVHEMEALYDEVAAS